MRCVYQMKLVMSIIFFYTVTVITTAADDSLLFLPYFLEKIRLDILFELSP